MQWVAKKRMKVQNEKGEIRVVEPGEAVPEAAKWNRPNLWCVAVPDGQVAGAKASAPASQAPAANSAPDADNLNTNGKGDELETVGGSNDKAPEGAGPSTSGTETEKAGDADQAPANQGSADQAPANQIPVIPAIDTLNKSDLKDHMKMLGIEFNANEDKESLWAKYQKFVAERKA